MAAVVGFELERVVFLDTGETRAPSLTRPRPSGTPSTSPIRTTQQTGSSGRWVSRSFDPSPTGRWRRTSSPPSLSAGARAWVRARFSRDKHRAPAPRRWRQCRRLRTGHLRRRWIRLGTSRRDRFRPAASMRSLRRPSWMPGQMDSGSSGPRAPITLPLTARPTCSPGILAAATARTLSSTTPPRFPADQSRRQQRQRRLRRAERPPLWGLGLAPLVEGLRSPCPARHRCERHGLRSPVTPPGALDEWH